MNVNKKHHKVGVQKNKNFFFYRGQDCVDKFCKIESQNVEKIREFK